MILRPERKIVVNGLPKTIKNIRERERTRTTDAEGRIIRRRLKSKDMMKKNFIS
jgi:hypothetical protein